MKKRNFEMVLKESFLGSLRVLSNKKYVIMSGLLILTITFLLRGAVKGTLRSPVVRSARKFPGMSYSEILNAKIPNKLKISEDSLLKQKAKDPVGLLRQIMDRADSDRDQKLNEKELTLWIHIRIVDHLDRAIQDNIMTFTRHDTNHDGKMSWQEFFIKYMAERGYSQEKALELINDYSSLSQTVKEELAMHRASWSQAEMSEPGYLNINEYLSFMHPEHNHVTLVNMVDEMLTSLDDDGNEKISQEEYVNLAYKHDSEISDDEWKKERTMEFNSFVDVDGNGFLMKKELLMFVDPKNPQKAMKEAKSLLRKADKNKDNMLSLEEIFDHQKAVLDSKLVDVGKTMHAEY